MWLHMIGSMVMWLIESLQNASNCVASVWCMFVVFDFQF